MSNPAVPAAQPGVVNTEPLATARCLLPSSDTSPAPLTAMTRTALPCGHAEQELAGTGREPDRTLPRGAGSSKFAYWSRP